MVVRVDLDRDLGAGLELADDRRGDPQVGAIGVALGCGLGGATLVYLDAPSRREKPPAGAVRAEGDDPTRPS